MTIELKTRVFLSCGQNSEEKKIVMKIKKAIEKLGYDVYVATEEHNPDSFKENIYGHLENSDYFLFIDFKREKLSNTEKAYRGSLFSNQELAIASYLGLDILAFQEEGVEEHTGVMQFIIVNPIKFTDRTKLIKEVLQKVKDNWQTGWHRGLNIKLSREVPNVKKYANVERPGLWFHLDIENLHRSKQALNCTGFVVEIRDKDNKEITPDLSELKWRGITISHQVVIPPKMKRKLDAFHIFKDDKYNIVLGVNPYLVDSTAIVEKYTLKGPGTFKVKYRVYSDNFPSVDSIIHIDVDKERMPYLKLVNGDVKLNVSLVDFEKGSIGTTASAEVVTYSFSPGGLSIVGNSEDYSQSEDYKMVSGTVTGNVHMPIVMDDIGTIPSQAFPSPNIGAKICPMCGADVTPFSPKCEKCGAIYHG